MKPSSMYRPLYCSFSGIFYGFKKPTLYLPFQPSPLHDNKNSLAQSWQSWQAYLLYADVAAGYCQKADVAAGCCQKADVTAGYCQKKVLFLRAEQVDENLWLWKVLKDKEDPYIENRISEIGSQTCRHYEY